MPRAASLLRRYYVRAFTISRTERPMASTTVFLDLLGPQRASEKGTTCPGDLPPASDPELVERARAARAALGERAFVLGHHYQRDEVIAFADARGDSFRLAQQAAAGPRPSS